MNGRESIATLTSPQSTILIFSHMMTHIGGLWGCRWPDFAQFRRGIATNWRLVYLASAGQKLAPAAISIKRWRHRVKHRVTNLLSRYGRKKFWAASWELGDAAKRQSSWKTTTCPPIGERGGATHRRSHPPTDSDATRRRKWEDRKRGTTATADMFLPNKKCNHFLCFLTYSLKFAPFPPASAVNDFPYPNYAYHLQ